MEKKSFARLAHDGRREPCVSVPVSVMMENQLILGALRHALEKAGKTEMIARVDRHVGQLTACAMGAVEV